MAVRGDITVNFDSSPRIITVAAPSTTVTIQDLVDTLRALEAEQVNMSYATLLKASGKDDLGGSGFVGITATLQNALLSFEARSGPAYAQCSVTGGNLVAVDANNLGMNPVNPTAFTQVIVFQSTSPTLVTTGGGAGATPSEIAVAVWSTPVSDNQTAGTFGEYVTKKLLTLKQFIGLS